MAGASDIENHDPQGEAVFEIPRKNKWRGSVFVLESDFEPLCLNSIGPSSRLRREDELTMHAGEGDCDDVESVGDRVRAFVSFRDQLLRGGFLSRATSLRLGDARLCTTPPTRDEAQEGDSSDTVLRRGDVSVLHETASDIRGAGWNGGTPVPGVG